jgi:hypothetical protein
MSIPASQIVSVVPGVIGAGGSALSLNGIILTENTAIPIGAVQPFSTAAAVSAFFGATAVETLLASQYFLGYEGATQTPAQLSFVQYPVAPVAAYLRGGSVASMTLAQLQALTGTLTLTVDGTPITSSTISLTAATSFSQAASIIQGDFTSPPFTVSYDSIRQAFVFTTTATGSAATIGFASGTLAAGLNLTQATGAVLSQGAAASTPGAAMTAITQVTQNWAAFMTAFYPVTADKVSFAEWTSQQNNRYVYVMWDNDAAALTTPDTTTANALIRADGYGGTCAVYCDPVIDPNGIAAAFVLGTTAAINFNQTNGRITYAFKYQQGVPVSVTNVTNASNLEANGFNFVGQYATANQGFQFFYPGSVSGQYDFLDEYVNQIYLNSQFQLAMMELLTNTPSVPYNAAGNALIHAACQDPINQALNFGSIRPGVALSSLQAAEVNNAAGVAIDQVLGTRGWYLQIGTATAQVRGARQSPPLSFWYMDGGAVQQLNLPSILVQ